MKYRNLGSAGVRVSSLCLGTMTFGEPPKGSFMHGVGASDEVSFAIMDQALELGVNFWDTADVYGNNGLSERILGRWFDQRKRRDDVVLATKFRFKMDDGPNGSGGSRHRIVRACEDSLRRMNTDRIDLYQIHMQDLDVPEAETLRALDDLVRAGKVLYVGCSNYAAYRLADSLWISETKGWERFVTLQAQYSLVVRDIEREHIPLCGAHGLGLLTWSPLGAGFLSGKYRKDQTPPPGSRLTMWEDARKRFDNERCWKTIDAVLAVAKETSSTPAQVSLAWVMSRPAVSSVIFGARTVAQLEDNVKASDLELSEAHLKTLTDASEFKLGYPYSFLKMVQGRW